MRGLQWICQGGRRDGKRDESFGGGPQAQHDAVFDAVRIGLDTAGFDLRRAGALETEAAGRQVGVADAHRRAEGAAGERAVRVEVAAAGRGIEDGAGDSGVLGEIGIRLVAVGQRSARSIARKSGGEERQLILGPGDDRRRPVRITDRQLGEAAAQARGVQAVDGKGPVAALRAAGPAGQPVAGQCRGLAHRLVDDLEKTAVGVFERTAFEGAGVSTHAPRGYHRTVWL
jgi:hypothetical protein